MPLLISLMTRLLYSKETKFQKNLKETWLHICFFCYTFPKTKGTSSYNIIFYIQKLIYLKLFRIYNNYHTIWNCVDNEIFHSYYIYIYIYIINKSKGHFHIQLYKEEWRLNIFHTCWSCISFRCLIYEFETIQPFNLHLK